MRILFIILTIAGILLLVLLALAALCLFYPVSYRAKGRFLEDAFFEARFWWLFHIFRLEISYGQDGKRFCLGIFWVKKTFGEAESPPDSLKEDELWPDKSGEDARVQKNKPENEYQEQERTADLAENNREGISVQREEPEEIKASRKDEPKETRATRKDEPKETRATRKDEPEEKKGSQKDEPKKSKALRKRKPKKRHKKVKNKPESSRFSQIKEKQDGWKDKYGRFRTEITDEKNRMALRHMWKEICYLFYHIKPRHAEGEIDFCAGDPAVTGQITGVISLFPLFYCSGVQVCPDFLSEEIYVRGNISLDGRMSFYHAALCLIRVIRDPNIMGIVQKFR